MQRFQFSLETVLRVKSRQEERALAEFAQSQAELISAQRSLTELLQEKMRHLWEVSRHQQGTLNIGNLMLSQSCLQRLNQKIGLQEQEIAQLEEKLEVRRQAVVEAQRERKTLEILKEKQWIQHQKELQQEEQHFLDEIAGARRKSLGSDG